jgi:hypothetical protein
MYREMKLLFYPEYHGAGEKAKPKEVLLDMDTWGKWRAWLIRSLTARGNWASCRAHAAMPGLVKQVFRYMTGRQDTRADVPVIRRALEDFRSSGSLPGTSCILSEAVGPAIREKRVSQLITRALDCHAASFSRADPFAGACHHRSAAADLDVQLDRHAYAAEANPAKKTVAFDRLRLWFNGNGIRSATDSRPHWRGLRCHRVRSALPGSRPFSLCSAA